MKPADIESLARALAPVISSSIAAELSVLNGRVDDLGKSYEEILKVYEGLHDSASDREKIEDVVRSEVSKIPPAKDGADADMAALRAHLEDLVSQIPRPQDGKSVTAEDVAPLLENQVNKWALEFERRAQDTLQKAIDKIPVPKDGKDGRDGVGFDDLEIEYDGSKTVTFKLVRGDITKQFDLTMPVVVDCGVFKDGHIYTPGDSVTWAGSYWIAQKETGAKPDSPESGWRLAVKKGRDGKDGRNGIDKTAPVNL